MVGGAGQTAAGGDDPRLNGRSQNLLCKLSGSALNTVDELGNGLPYDQCFHSSKSTWVLGPLRTIYPEIFMMCILLRRN